MPNHITTLCTVTGDAESVEAFRAQHVRLITEGHNAGHPFFDFETVIPKPKCVHDTERGFDPSGDNNVGDAEVEMYARALIENRRTYVVARYPWLPAHVQKWGDVIAWLDETKPAAKRWARASLLCAAETGYPGWYEWSCANWGTKWGAYDYGQREYAPGRFVFEFQTAWNTPVPIFRKLAEMWPTLTIEIESIDEGGGEYVGRCHAGACTVERVSDDPARYRRVYGRDPYRDDDEQAEA